ncbi:carboxypeptidase-like regulatory domain-containing protein [Hymenobacter sp. H14-R3]|uniref:carboxypeptidase-like regulatory domain-containing protein n=1 Tax=Hymenobacter sp. H14-R3 TaxID=3046308 RepID=UPI0024B8AA41|nr:carboxypeptidase-like regulatory domain-containing protein [Hymenobacter sp. H14-R3]MDJ0367905.1 carboxypeptidase-like regulatory domain-containing protein [Hymenobacter sp. H14-R3]
MKLTSSPFNPTTGELLPVYRDAYLRGDLSRQHNQAVDAYLQAHRALADDTLYRFHYLRQQGEAVRPVGWMQRQMDLIRVQPQRFRQRAAALVAVAVCMAGASMAATHFSGATPTSVTASAAGAPSLGEAAASATALITVRGRVLDENGRPLIGATVLNKQTGSGVATDANGAYAFQLPATQAASNLQVAYGGYIEDEIKASSSTVERVTLVPRADAGRTKHRRHWLFF